MPSKSSRSSKSSGSASLTWARNIAGGLRAETLHSGGRAQQPRDGMEGDLAGVRLAEGGEHLDTTGSLPWPKARAPDGFFRCQAPHHADHSAVALDCTVQQALDGGHLPPPTDQIRLSTPDGAMLFAHAQQAVGRTGLSAPLI